MMPQFRTVAHAANQVGIAGLLHLPVAAADKGRECVAFRALRRVVDVLGAHAAVLIRPLGGKIDSRIQSRECTFVVAVEVACVASGAGASIFNARSAKSTTQLVLVLIPKSSTGVACGALCNGNWF